MCARGGRGKGGGKQGGVRGGKGTNSRLWSDKTYESGKAAGSGRMRHDCLVMNAAPVAKQGKGVQMGIWVG